MTKQNYILIALFVAVLILALALGCSFMFNANAKVHADYQDILNDSNAIVNFNQYINISSVNEVYTLVNPQTIRINSTLTGAKGVDITSITFINGHKYYFYSSLPFNRLVFSYNSGGVYTPSSQYEIFTSSSSINGFYLYAGETPKTISFNIIDLTQMFGADNEPNLQQCQDLFVSDYYSYNTGSSVSLSGLNSYAQGFSDAYNSFEYIISNDLLASNTYLNEGSRLWTNSGSWLSVDMVNNVGSFGFRFPSSLINGDVITLSMSKFIFMTTSSIPSGTIPYFYVGYFDNGSFVSLGSFDLSIYALNFANSGTYEQNYNVLNNLTINVPKTLDNIYFRFSYTDAIEFSAVQLHIDVQSMNVSYAIQNAVDIGFDRAKEIYETQLQSYTDVDGAGYQNIYDLGYQAGQNASVSAARKKTYTFAAFLGALFDVPVNTIKSLLDFNFLGFNLKNFVFSLLTLSIVFALIKFILVKSGGDK